MNPWMTHKVGWGPSSWRQCWACTTLLRANDPHRSRIVGLTASKLLLNRMLCTRPLAIHSATGFAGRDEIRGTSVGAGNESSLSFAAPSSA